MSSFTQMPRNRWERLPPMCRASEWIFSRLRVTNCTHPKEWVHCIFAKASAWNRLIHGASHESGRRAGTENVLLDVGLGAACELAHSWIGNEKVRELRDLFWDLLKKKFGDGVVLNGHPTERLPNTLNVSFVGKSDRRFWVVLDDVAASTGSACHSGSVELSPVLKAMAVAPEVGMGAIRFSLGRTTTREEIEEVVDRLKQILVR